MPNEEPPNARRANRLVGLLVHLLNGLSGAVQRAHRSCARREVSKKFIHAANRLMQWDSSVSLPELRKTIPEGDWDTVDGDQQAADACAVGSIKSVPGGEVVDMQRLEQLEAPRSCHKKSQPPSWEK